MSALARTALRLSVVSALNADPTIGRLVQGCVYDSRITALDAMEPKPVIIVYTEDETGDQFSRNNGGPPFDAVVDLVLEISMKATEPSDDSEGVDLLTPYTDAELEATLDLIEERAIDAITVANTPQSRLVRQAVARRVSKMRSSRFVLDGTGDKLATRLVTLTTELKTPEPDHLLDVPVCEFGNLPDPLRAVCSALDRTSAGYTTCKAIAARWSGPDDEPFAGADLTYQPRQLTSEVNPLTAPDSPLQQGLANPDQSVLLTQEVDLSCPTTPPSSNS